MAKKRTAFNCPDGCTTKTSCGPMPSARLIESTEPQGGEYKDVCTCDECGIIFYIVRDEK